MFSGLKFFMTSLDYTGKGLYNLNRAGGKKSFSIVFITISSLIWNLWHLMLGSHSTPATQRTFITSAVAFHISLRFCKLPVFAEVTLSNRLMPIHV